MKSIKEGIPVPTKIFNISEKTTHKVLASSLGSRGQITNDIVQNAMELVPDIDWILVLSYIEDKDTYGRIRSRNKSAIANSIALPISSVATHMGWDMHSPEVVYMSSFHPLKFISQRLTKLEELSKSNRVFLTDEQREIKLQKEREEVSVLTPIWKKLKWSLEEYARQNLPDDSIYLRILENLSYLGKSMRTRKKEKIYDLLKEGKLAEAASFLGIAA